MDFVREEVANLFRVISKTYSGTLSISRMSWFNGEAYMPLITYKIDYSVGVWKGNVIYEHRISQYKKSGFLSGGEKSDRHLFFLTLKRTSDISDVDFRLFCVKSIFSFFNSKKEIIKIKTSNSGIIELLKSDKILTLS